MIKLSVILFAMFLIIGCGEKKSDNNANMTDTTSMPATQDTMNKAEKENFVTEAASGGMMEVRLGNLAQQKASSADVKKFGKRMVTDHSKANNELKTVADKNNITLPDSMLQKHSDMVNDLMGMSGSEFDKAYMNMMVSDHTEDVKKFEDASTNEANADVKAWAGKTLPVLREHLSQAQKVNDKLK